MKETIYTIPINEAVDANDECMFCNIERKLNQDGLDYILGSAAAYMQVDIRAVTDRIGFCRKHYKEMFQYGNALGNAIMLSSYYKKINDQLKIRLNNPLSKKTAIFKHKKSNDNNETLTISNWIHAREEECQICDYFNEHYKRYMETFFMMLKEDDFYKKLMNSKGFCMHHYADIVEYAEENMSGRSKEETIRDIGKLMKDNMDRVYEDLEWFIKKFDYRFKNEDWKESKDALPRAMQKLGAGYPADDYYMSKK